MLFLLFHVANQTNAVDIRRHFPQRSNVHPNADRSVRCANWRNHKLVMCFEFLWMNFSCVAYQSMILSNIALQRFQIAHEQFQKCWFSNTIRTDNGNTTRQIDTEIRLNEQRRLVVEIEINIWKLNGKKTWIELSVNSRVVEFQNGGRITYCANPKLVVAMVADRGI